jgi:hypothetical protein
MHGAGHMQELRAAAVFIVIIIIISSEPDQAQSVTMKREAPGPSRAAGPL